MKTVSGVYIATAGPQHMIRANQATARGVDSGGRKKDPKWNQ